MGKITFCDNHNMVAILEKTEHNSNFHQIVDFLEASHIRYALTVRPTVYVSHIRQFWSTSRIETTDAGTKIIAQVDGKQRTISESSIRKDLKLKDEEGISTLPDAELFENLTLMAVEPASPPRDDSHEEAFPTATSLDAGQDRENITKTSAIPHKPSSRVTSLDGGEGSVQQKLNELMELCTTLQQQQGDAPKDSSRSTEKGSDSSGVMANVLGTLEAINILASGGLKSTFTTASPLVAPVSAPVATASATVSPAIATASQRDPTAAVSTTASITTPYSRRTRVSRGIILEFSQPSHTINAQVARELVEEFAQEARVLKEQAERDSEITRLQAEEELRLMIDELDRSNEMVNKHMAEYEQAEQDLSLRKLYMVVLRSHAGWKTKDFKGMTFEQIEEKFTPVWEKMQDFIPMDSKQESERFKRPGIQLGQRSSKRLKTAKPSGSDASQRQQTKDPKDLYEDELKKMMELVLIEEVYVDDIIFGSTKKSLCDEFEGLMHKRFQMSSMGELTFFLGLQTASTPMEPNKALIKDEEADSVDVHLYRSMIRSLMYLTASRPDITFAVCACARFQVTPKTSHLHAVKRIFRYLKGLPKLGLWYSRDSPFDLEAFSDSDYVGAGLDRKCTTGGCQFLGKRLISWQCKKQTIVVNSTTKAENVAAANCYGQKPIIVPSSCQPKKTHKHRKAIRTTKISQSSGPINLVVDETVYKEWEDRMERAATTASSLDAEHDSDAQTRFETTFKKSNDPPLSRGYTLGSGEDSMKLLELMELCTKLSNLVSKKKSEML
ncbi:hypothetical protein Tco_0393614 [Tanacetum coccineum]